MRSFIVFLLVILIFIMTATHYYELPYTNTIGDNVSIEVRNVEDFDIDAKILIITRIGEHLIVEVIRGPGINNVDTFKDGDAIRFLKYFDIY